MVMGSEFTMIRPDANDERRALDIMDRHADLSLTLTDAVNMAVMQERGIGMVFSFDSDFLIMGFLRIPPMPPLGP